MIPRTSMNLVLVTFVTLASLACDAGKVDTDAGGLGQTTEVGSGALDNDGDGFAGVDDCNDADAAINPGAIEICDGVDNNCSGEVDEGVTNTVYADSDGDGYGAAELSIESCDVPSGFVPDDTDCDDTDATVHPGSMEICNGIDDNCDTVIDEGVAVRPSTRNPGRRI